MENTKSLERAGIDKSVLFVNITFILDVLLGIFLGVYLFRILPKPSFDAIVLLCIAGIVILSVIFIIAYAEVFADAGDEEDDYFD